MTDPISIFLPLNTYINVMGFTNAVYLQQVTITDELGNMHAMQGSGEHNQPMENGTYAFTTPASSKSPAGFQITVLVQNQEGGQWVPSNVTSGKVSVAYYNLVLVVSEDSTDEDWNDAVVQFSWWSSPS